MISPTTSRAPETMFLATKIKRKIKKCLDDKDDVFYLPSKCLEKIVICLIKRGSTNKCHEKASKCSSSIMSLVRIRGRHAFQTLESPEVCSVVNFRIPESVELYAQLAGPDSRLSKKMVAICFKQRQHLLLSTLLVDQRPHYKYVSHIN